MEGLTQNFSEFPIDMKRPPLKTKTLLESNPLKSRVLVRQKLAAPLAFDASRCRCRTNREPEYGIPRLRSPVNSQMFPEILAKNKTSLL